MSARAVSVSVLSRRPLVAEALASGLETLGLDAVPGRWASSAHDTSDVVVLDLADRDLATALADAPPTTREQRTVLVVDTWSAQHERVAAHCHADGAVLRDAHVREVAHAVRSVARGVQLPAPAVSDMQQRIDRLTGRELEVLAGLARGARNDALARQLGISPHTVRTHVQNLLGKLGVDNRLAAAAVARQYGLLNVVPAT